MRFKIKAKERNNTLSNIKYWNKLNGSHIKYGKRKFLIQINSYMIDPNNESFNIVNIVGTEINPDLVFLDYEREIDFGELFNRIRSIEIKINDKFAFAAVYPFEVNKLLRKIIKRGAIV